MKNIFNASTHTHAQSHGAPISEIVLVAQKALTKKCSANHRILLKLYLNVHLHQRKPWERISVGVLIKLTE